MIQINGSKYEGGGSILRISSVLSAVVKKPCRVFNIRKNRPKPGLSPQHLAGIKALAELCNGRLEGDYLGSQEIKFYPEEITAKNLLVKIGSAGSITLVMQTLIPAAIHSPGLIKISFDGGATDTFFSPTIDHFRHVFLKILEKMLVPRQAYPDKKKLKVNIEVKKRGFYPEGQAKVEAEVLPSLLKPIILKKRGLLKKVLIISGASENLKKNRVAQRQISGAKQILGKLKLPLEEKVKYYSSFSTGSQINIIAELENTVFGANDLGKLGKSAEQVGKEAAQNFLKEVQSEACLDKYVADQILPYMALAQERSEVTVSEITSHCQTNIWLIEKFLDGKFKIEGNKISWLPK